MKKHIWFWLLIMICFSPFQVSAQETKEIHGEWINSLSQEKEIAKTDEKYGIASFSNDRELTEEIAEALQQRKTDFTINYSGNLSGIEGEIKQSIQAALLNDEYLSFDLRGYSYSGSGINGDFNLFFSVKYYQNANQEAYVDKEIQRILQEIIQPDMNNHEKVKAVHDYIVLNVEYDTSYNQNVNAPYFALTGGKTLCNGYAMLAYKMLKELEIPVRLISGTAGDIGHAWNLVQLDEEWYHLDATWDDPIPDVEGRVLYDYYLIPDDLMARDHFWKDGGLNGYEKPYPAANADYAEMLSALGDTELLESLGLHYLNAEYTSYTDEEFVQLVSNYFNKMAEDFSIRFVTADRNIKEKVSELIYEAAGKTDTKSWSYSWKEYPRSKEKDYIVTVSNIDYFKQISSIEMSMLPERTLIVGEKIPLLVSATLSNGTHMEVTEQASFTVGDPAVAEINKGYLTAKKAGSTVVRVSYQGKETSFSIKVEEGLKEISYPMDGYKPFGEQMNVDSEKIWTIEFNHHLSSYLSDADVYVVNRFGEKRIHFIELADHNTVKVHPPTGGYEAGETYYLVIEDSFRSAKGDLLKEAVTFKFIIEQ